MDSLPLNRRDLCLALSAFAAFAPAALAVPAEPPQSPAQSTKEPGSLPETMAVPAPPGSPGDKVLDSPHVFAFDKLPVVKTANGESRAVTRGVLPTGEAVELHETTLLPGHMPHPSHKHRHSEFVMVREGRIQMIADNRPGEVVGPGGVLFFASNKLHGLKNVGDAPANYFVIAIGRES